MLLTAFFFISHCIHQPILDNYGQTVPFHNFFVKSLFHNARYAHHIPLSSKYNLSAKYGQPAGRLMGKNQRSLTSHLVTNKQQPINQLQALGAGSSAQLYLQPTPQTSITDSLLALHTQGLVNPELKNIQAATASLDLPDRETIAMRMRSVAAEMGLTSGVHNECANLLMQAMHNYLKNLVSKCIQFKNNKIPKELLSMRANKDYKPKKGTFLVRKTHPSFKIKNALHSYSHYKEEVPYLNNYTKKLYKKRKRDEFETNDEDEDNSDNDYQLDEKQMIQIAQQDTFVITLRDLLTAVQCCPFLLGDCEKVREKISASNWDLF
jgi:hypothetical protein